MTEAPIHVTHSGERRAGWHTQEDCNNMKTVDEKFDEGSARMKRIEESILKISNHQTDSDASRARMELKLDENNEAIQRWQAAVLDMSVTSKP